MIGEHLSMWLYLLASVFFLAALIYGIWILVMRKRAKPVTGKIADIQLASAHPIHINAPRRAQILYYIDGKEYLSKSQITVPMTAKIGDKVAIKYITSHPSRLFTQTYRYMVTLLLMAAFCILMALLQNDWPRLGLQ
jgi:hypothetical protein